MDLMVPMGPIKTIICLGRRDSLIVCFFFFPGRWPWSLKLYRGNFGMWESIHHYIYNYMLYIIYACMIYIIYIYILYMHITSLGVPGVTEEPFGEVVPDKPFKPELLPRKLFGISGGQCGPKGCWAAIWLMGLGRQNMLKGDHPS